MAKKSRPVRRTAKKSQEEVQSPVIRVGVVFLVIMAIAIVAYVVKHYLP